MSINDLTTKQVNDLNMMNKAAQNIQFGTMLNEIIHSNILEVNPDNYIYVGKNGNDTTGNGSAEQPYLTIQKAINVAISGTTIFTFPGIYTEDITLKAGVNLVTSAKYNTYVIGKVTANYTGTVFIEMIIFKNSSGITLDFAGTGVQNLQCSTCIFESTGTNANSAINWSNTNSSSRILMSDGVVTAYSSASGAKAFTSASNSAGSLIASNTTFQILDNLNNICLNIAGAIVFTHTIDVINGQIVTSNTARFNVSMVAITTTSVAVLVHNSTNATPSTVSNVIITTTASPVVTGSGALIYAGIFYGSTGLGAASTLNGGLGAIALPMAAIKIRNSALLPSAMLASGYGNGVIEFDGTHLYIICGTTRYSLNMTAV